MTNSLRTAAACLLALTLPAVLPAAETAREVWEGLAAQRAQSPAFAFVENDPSLPNAFIYGDSISIHYTPRLREALAGQANVYRLHNNGSDSGAFIAKFTQLHSAMRDESVEGHWSFQWDVIHFNVGLHDLKFMANGKLDKENGTQVTSTEQYAANLRAIISFLQKFAPGAKLIFATTTPVPENSGGRVAGDAAVYNEVARQVLQDYPEIMVNDLHAFTLPHQPEWWTKPGDVHFNPAGTRAQGDEVARVILDALNR